MRASGPFFSSRGSCRLAGTRGRCPGRREGGADTPAGEWDLWPGVRVGVRARRAGPVTAWVLALGLVLSCGQGDVFVQKKKLSERREMPDAAAQTTRPELVGPSLSLEGCPARDRKIPVRI